MRGLAPRLTDEEYRELIASTRERAMRSTCPAGQVGALIVLDREWSVYGVNGSPWGVETCDEAGCAWVPAGIAGTGRDHARHLHAEAAAICHTASLGRRTDGCDIVVTQAPCPTCALLIVSARLGRVVVPASGVPAGWEPVRATLALARVEVIVVEGA